MFGWHIPVSHTCASMWEIKHGLTWRFYLLNEVYADLNIDGKMSAWGLTVWEKVPVLVTLSSRFVCLDVPLPYLSKWFDEPLSYLFKVVFMYEIGILIAFSGLNIFLRYSSVVNSPVSGREFCLNCCGEF